MRKALAVDLDGTLLKGNSFRDYLLFCTVTALRYIRPGIALSILLWVVLRKIRWTSHSRMKRVLLEKTSPLMSREDNLDRFVGQELTRLNAMVLGLMDHYRECGYLLVLTTAAPEFYARPISEKLQFDFCCATPLPVGGYEWMECAGEQKVNTLRSLLQEQDAEPDVVITNHYDDLPLLHFNALGRNIVVNASVRTRQTLAARCMAAYEIMD